MKYHLIVYKNEIPFDSLQNGIPFNCLQHILSSFGNNEPLNNDQKEFIKRLCNDNSEWRHPINFNTIAPKIIKHDQPCFNIDLLAIQLINDNSRKYCDFSEVYHAHERIELPSTEMILI